MKSMDLYHIVLNRPSVPDVRFPGSGAIIIAMRTETQALNQNRELYALGGSATGIKSAQVTAGQFVAPTPSYQLNFPNRQAARVASDFCLQESTRLTLDVLSSGKAVGRLGRQVGLS